MRETQRYQMENSVASQLPSIGCCLGSLWAGLGDFSGGKVELEFTWNSSTSQSWAKVSVLHLVEAM